MGGGGPGDASWIWYDEKYTLDRLQYLLTQHRMATDSHVKLQIYLCCGAEESLVPLHRKPSLLSSALLKSNSNIAAS